MKISGNKILITGGASGIGIGLASRFIEENNIVIICGRREKLPAEVASMYPSIITRKCDLSVASQREDLYKWISEEHNDLNILVNNAGIQQRVEVTDKGLHSNAPLVSDFIEAVFTQLKSGKNEITFGFSESMLKATPDDLQKAFSRMNSD